MPFGRGRFGWGRGWGRGNPYPFCRNLPWLPRWWWAMPYASRYGATIPYPGYGYPYLGYGHPYYGYHGYMQPYW